MIPSFSFPVAAPAGLGQFVDQRQRQQGLDQADGGQDQRRWFRNRLVGVVQQPHVAGFERLVQQPHLVDLADEFYDYSYPQDWIEALEMMDPEERKAALEQDLVPAGCGIAADQFPIRLLMDVDQPSTVWRDDRVAVVADTPGQGRRFGAVEPDEP